VSFSSIIVQDPLDIWSHHFQNLREAISSHISRKVPQMAQNEKIKICLVGPAHAGKTCLANRWTKDEFTGVRQQTIGITLGQRSYTAGGRSYTIQLADAAGQTSGSNINIVDLAVRHADLLFLCFDPTSRESDSKSLDYWAQALANCPVKRVVLVATKSDLRTSGLGDGWPSREELLKRYGAEELFDTSAKENIGINELFDWAITQHLRDPNKPSRGVQLVTGTQETKRGCCE
jgi:small GTP-binding protein